MVNEVVTYARLQAKLQAALNTCKFSVPRYVPSFIVLVPFNSL